MSGLLTTLVAIELALTAVVVIAFVYRARLTFKEQNTLILDDAELHLVEGQATIHARANQMDKLFSYSGIGWLVFGLAALAVWLGEGIGFI